MVENLTYPNSNYLELKIRRNVVFLSKAPPQLMACSVNNHIEKRYYFYSSPHVKGIPIGPISSFVENSLPKKKKHTMIETCLIVAFNYLLFSLDPALDQDQNRLHHHIVYVM